MHPSPSTGIRLSFVLALVMIALAGAQVRAQGDSWQWPARAQNLQSLPADFPPERLRAVMTGFSRSLGVRCSHCHQGEEGQPLSQYDFAVDTPVKQTTRQMLAMLGDINDHLNQVEPSGSSRVNFWCHSCHAGRARPMTLEETLRETLHTADAAAAVRHYRELKERYYGRGAYDFGEGALNTLGYELLGEGRADAAILLFRLAVEEHPESANALDSLAESYLESGQPELARVFYAKSLELDPDNRNAVEKLRELAGRPK